MESEYDIFRGKESEDPVWVGSITGFDRAVEIMNRMAGLQPDDYFVFSSVRSGVVAVWENQNLTSDRLGLGEPKKLGKSA